MDTRTGREALLSRRKTTKGTAWKNIPGTNAAEKLWLTSQCDAQMNPT